MTRTTTACLVDLYDTLLTVDFARHSEALADCAGADRTGFATAFAGWSQALMDGSATLTQALAASAVAGGASPDPDSVQRLVGDDLRMLRELSVVPDDTVPFLEALRGRGVRIAVVSNCAASTRPLLGLLGLDDLADVLVLSCEENVVKPHPHIYEVALDRLQVGADQAVLVDDKEAYCEGARTLGVRALRFSGVGRRGALLGLLPDV